MLRSLYSGISGLRSHQTMLDVTGNNIANVNTAGFKSSAVVFQDTLSQLIQGAGGAAAGAGGTNPAQVGLGVQVAGITTNFTGGAAQATGRSTDMMISGDGFFVVQSGGETLYTRAGSFDFDAAGRLVTPNGALVMGWPAQGGVVNQGGGLVPVQLPANAVAPAVATTQAAITGNLPSTAAIGTTLVRDIVVHNGVGAESTLTLTFERTATGWDVDATDGATTVSGALTYDATGAFTGSTVPAFGGIALDFAETSGYADLQTVSISSQNGREAGTLQSYTLSPDGTLVGSFSNGASEPIARIALSTFVNPGGLEKVGSSMYRASLNSGLPQLAAAGSDGTGSLLGGRVEMSNVDLSQEFTNLIVAQRGFQANARIITTSDEVLQELTNLKR
jgi:flagellar hook protein FlgE